MSLKETGICQAEKVVETNNFEEDPYIEGVITEMKTITIEGEDREVITIMPENGEEKAVWVNVVLRKQLEKADVIVGDKVGIEYEGKRPLASRPGQSVKLFKLYTEA